MLSFCAHVRHKRAIRINGNLIRAFDLVTGNGMHLNISLWDVDGKVNLFPGDGDMGLSDTARHFLAGVMYHARSTSAILCPSTNSYKRYVVSYPS